MVAAMSFIQPDEFIILVDDPRIKPWDLARLREAGIRTAFNVIRWESAEKRQGEYDWSAPDALIARMRAVGIKSLIRCHDNAPDFFPDDWYLRSANGSLWKHLSGWGGNDPYTCLSPWGPGADRELDFMRICQERYTAEDVLLFAGGPHGGEVILPGMIPNYCDRHALESFRAFAREKFKDDLEAFNKANTAQHTTWDAVVPADLPTYGSMQFSPTTVNWLSASLWASIKRQQEIFPEIWLSLVERNTQFAEAVESGPRSGNWLMADLCQYLPDETGHELSVLLWEVNREGGNQGALNNVSAVLDRTWIGSQFCEGLRRYTAESIAAGLRGFITAPLMNARNGGQIEEWMLEAFRWSLAQWREARL